MHNVAQEMGDARRARVTAKANNQSDGRQRNQGLAPNMRRRLAYLSGRDEDVMEYLYGNQALEIMHRTREGRHVRQGNGGGDPDGGNDLQGGDGGGGDRPPSRNDNNENQGRNPPNRRNDTRGGGRPLPGPPGPPGGPPSDSGYQPSECPEDMAEANQNYDRQGTNGGQGRCPEYLRGL